MVKKGIVFKLKKILIIIFNNKNKIKNNNKAHNKNKHNIKKHYHNYHQKVNLLLKNNNKLGKNFENLFQNNKKL